MLIVDAKERRFRVFPNTKIEEERHRKEFSKAAQKFNIKVKEKDLALELKEYIEKIAYIIAKEKQVKSIDLE